MNFKTTAILACVLVIILGAVTYVWFSARNDAPAALKPILSELKNDEIKSIKVTTKDGKILVLEKSGKEWAIAQPFKAPADSFRVDSLIRSLTTEKSLGDDEKSDLKTLRLDNPAYKVEIVGKKTWKISVSSKPTVGQNCYILLEGDPVRKMVSTSFVDTVGTSFDQYRSTKLLSDESSSIKRLSIKTGTDAPVVLEKVSQYDWAVVAPEKQNAETVEVNEYLTSLTGLTANEFVDELDIPALNNPAKYPNVTIWYTNEAPTTQPTTPATRPSGVTVRIGGYTSLKKDAVFVYLEPSGVYAKVAATSSDRFNKKVIDFKDRQIFKIEPKEVSKIKIVSTRDGKTTETVIDRKKADFTMGPAAAPTSQPTTKPANEDLPPSDWVLASGGEASNAEVENFISRFTPLRASKYLAADAAPVTQPMASHKVEITTDIAGQNKVYVLDIVEPTGIVNPIVTWNNTSFEMSRYFLETLMANFTNKVPPPEEPEMPQMFQGGGGMPGMMGM